MVPVIRALVNYLQRGEHVSPHREGSGERSNGIGRPVTSILVRQASSSTLPPLIKVIEHKGDQAVVVQNGVIGELPVSSGLPGLVFAEPFHSKAQDLGMLQALHQQIPDAKIIAFIDSC